MYSNLKLRHNKKMHIFSIDLTFLRLIFKASLVPNATNRLIPAISIALMALDADFDIISLGATSGAQGLSDFLDSKVFS